MNKLNRPIIHFILTGIVVIALYYPTTDYDFVLDDKMVITENNFVKKGTAGIPEIFGSDTMTGYLGEQPDLLAGGRYRPLSLIVFAVVYEFAGLDIYWYHLLNILFYLLACIVLYLLLRQLFYPEGIPDHFGKLFLLASTLLFAMHPVHTEAVANVKGMDEVLALLFGSAAFLLAFLGYDKGKKGFLFTGLLLYLLALLSKESTLPLVVAIPLAFWFFRKTNVRTVLNHFFLLAIPVVVYLVIRVQALGFLLNSEVNVTGIMNEPYFGASAGEKAGTVFYTLLLYLKLLVFPHPLTHDYYPYHIPLLGLSHPLAIFSFLVLAGLLAIAIRGIKTRSNTAYSIWYFFISISIVSNVVINVGTFMNERFLFIPSVAMPLLLIAVAKKVRGRKNFQVGTLAVMLLLAGGFTWKSASRIPDWQNAGTLNKAAIKVSYNSARANCFYAVSLYDTILQAKNSELKRNLIEEAQQHIDRSLEIYPEYSDALRMKAGLAAEIYKTDKDAEKLLRVFREVLEVKRESFVDEFTDWLEPRVNKETVADYYFDVGYNNFAQKGNLNLARYYLGKGYRINPVHRGILFGSTVVAGLSGKHTEAIQLGQQYIDQYGENAEILYYIGNAQVKTGAAGKGLKNMEEAFRLNPGLKTKTK